MPDDEREETARLRQELQENETLLARLREREVELLSLVSHELKSPLTNIQGYAQLLLRHPELSAEQQTRSMETILDEARRLGRLITDIVEAVRLDAGRMTLQRGQCDLSAQARVVVGKLDGNANRLIVDAAESLPPGPWDCERVGESLRRLVQALIMLGPEGEKVTLRLCAEDGSARAVVAGPPLPPEAVPVFDPSQTLSQAARREGGLSVFIAYRLVEAHGGRVQVDVAPAQRTHITFTLSYGD